jgi:hypothetical protein
VRNREDGISNTDTTHKPTRRSWIRGLIGAAALAIGCVWAGAWIIEWKDAPRPIRNQWPHMNPWLTMVVVAPAAVFWWFYFAYHWRGRVLFAECLTVIRQPLFWLILIVALLCCFWMLLPPAVRSAARSAPDSTAEFACQAANFALQSSPLLGAPPRGVPLPVSGGTTRRDPPINAN